MAIYEIKAYMQSTSYDKCWITIEADSPEEALRLAKEDPEKCEYLDGKTIDIQSNDFVDQDEWEICK